MTYIAQTATPLVSVIIPNYNHGAYLDQRIQSVLNQSYQNFEVFILDDCSTDNSREIIEKYRDNPHVVKIIYNDVNGGSVFKQWKKGVDLAQGKYIWVAESDDYCEASLLDNLVAGIEKHDNCVIAYCQSIAIDMQDNILFQSNYTKLEDVIPGKEFIVKKLTTMCAIFNASMALFRKDDFNAVNKEFLEFKYSGDWFFYVEMCRRGDVYVCGRALNYFRNHTGDHTTRSRKTGQNVVEALRIINRNYSEQLVPKYVYWKAMKKMHREFFWGRKNFDTNIQKDLHKSFYNRKKLRLMPELLILDATWKTLRLKISRKKR